MNGVSVSGLSFKYPNTDKFILGDISMDVAEGEFVCILGHSGCGKSTLLRLLAGLEEPTEGEIKLGDKVIKGADLDRAVVFQDYGLFPWMTAGENILLALKQKYPKESKQNLKARAISFLNSVDLSEEVFGKLPKELSGGMQQRCAIAQALSIDPPVLLMDEPFGALDAITRAKLQDLVEELWCAQEPKKTVFFVTHDVDEALLLATKIFVLGQSPASVIFQCSIDASMRTTRDAQFDNPEIVALRNTLMRHMTHDVNQHVDENASA